MKLYIKENNINYLETLKISYGAFCIFSLMKIGIFSSNLILGTLV